MKFLHSSDLQLGRPFSHVEDDDAKAALRQARIDALKKLGQTAKEKQCAFVLVAGDFFDSCIPGDRTIDAACSAIRESGVPFYIIPGNHDHAGAEGLWEKPFFRSSKPENLHILLEPSPIVREDAVILPCPLFRKQTTSSVHDWLSNRDMEADLPKDLPRIVLAHGSIQDFGSDAADEDDDTTLSNNFLDIDAIEHDVHPDYIALGDWHGMKKVNDRAWYSGTPEADRFPRGRDYAAGHALVVELGKRGALPIVECVPIGKICWHTPMQVQFAADEDLAKFKDDIQTVLNGRSQEDCLKVDLAGTLGLQSFTELEEVIRKIQAATLRCKIHNDVISIPSDDELLLLENRGQDPLVSAVATRLHEMLVRHDPEANIALRALRVLYAEVAGR